MPACTNSRCTCRVAEVEWILAMAQVPASVATSPISIEPVNILLFSPGAQSNNRHDSTGNKGHRAAGNCTVADRGTHADSEGGRFCLRARILRGVVWWSSLTS